jgi:hypothetical protein
MLTPIDSGICKAEAMIRGPKTVQREDLVRI